MIDIAHDLEIQGRVDRRLGELQSGHLSTTVVLGQRAYPGRRGGDANVKIIHHEVAIFETEWFSLQATGDRFALDTNDASKYGALKDLAVGTFKILEHTPIRAFGFNVNQHFKMRSKDEWHAFSDYYAPKEPWKDLIQDPGVRSLTIVGKRESCDADRIQVKVEPSAKVHPGLFINVNEHYGPPGDQKEDAATGVTRLLGAPYGFMG